MFCPAACTVVPNFCLDHLREHLLSLRRHFLFEGKRNGAARADRLEFSMRRTRNYLHEPGDQNPPMFRYNCIDYLIYI